MATLPTISEVKALHGRIFALLTSEESAVLAFYRAQGRKFDVAVAISGTTDAGEFSPATSQAQADEIAKRTNAIVSITVGAEAETRWQQAHRSVSWPQ